MPALNEASHIETGLKSLKVQSIGPEHYEIIVVDGGSEDETRSIAEKYAKKVITQEDPGIGGARRNGAQEASGRILAFTDADTILPNNWLEIISRNLNLYEASTGPVIFQDNNVKTDILTTWRGLYKLLNKIDFYYMIGANMAVRAETYQRIGGHSDISLLDDYDLSVKLFKNKATALYDSNQVVYTSSRRAGKLLTYGMTVAYGHYNYLVTKDYEKLLNYPKVEEMTVKDILKDNRLGRDVLSAMEALQTTIRENKKRIS